MAGEGFDDRVSGKVVHFDSTRGFGFLAPDAGGQDVFLHINDVDIDEDLLRPGAEVEFEVEDTDRGSKAVNVEVVGDAPESFGHKAFGRKNERSQGRDNRDSGRDRRPRRDRRSDGEMDASALSDELTEMLLDASGTLTAAQILAIRQRVTEFAVARGWVLD